ncbi:DNA-binding protein [Lysinibacillus fusiformis]|nr:DNA-binding protein [Lysinibacillus fusiformis]
MLSEEFKAQIMQEFRNMIREEMAATLLESNLQLQQLPPFLTKDELKELLRIKDTKASELLGRADFPVLREAGVLVPTHLFIQWVEANTQWIDINTGLAPNALRGLRAI